LAWREVEGKEPGGRGTFVPPKMVPAVRVFGLIDDRLPALPDRRLLAPANDEARTPAFPHKTDRWAIGDSKPSASAACSSGNFNIFARFRRVSI